MDLEKRIEELEKRIATLEDQVQEQPIKTNESNLNVEVIEVVHTSIKRGNGSTNNPIRIVNQYWSFKGDLLAEKDPID